MTKKMIFIMLVTCSVLYANQNNAYQNKLLFCLKKEVQPLKITKNERGDINTMYNEIDELLKRINAQNIEPWLTGATDNDFDGEIYLNRIYRISFESRNFNELRNIKNQLEQIAAIYSAEFEYIRKPFYTPNDSYYNNQWFLPAINSNDAWDLWTNSGLTPGNSNVILASVDTGVNWTHSDLRNNIWQNLGEDADGDGRTIESSGNNWYLDPGDLNGIDDDDWDNNSLTYIDDLIGWDPAGLGGLDDNNPDPPNSSGWAHGTHVAGLLAATTNNSNGIASTAFNCSIMSVKVSDENQGSDVYITDGYDGILYAAKAGFYSQGFSVINNSWGGGGFSVYENATINTCVNEYNAIIVCAAGNGSTTGWGEAYEVHYPSSYENSIAVCPLGSNNSWNHWATYHETIDLAAPGENIRSTTTAPNGYSSWDGSSMASPVAASVFGLLKSYNLDWTNEMVQTMVLATADPIIYTVNSENYLDGMLGKGRVDSYKALTTPLFPKIEYSGEDIILINDSNGIINPGDQFELSLILFNYPDWGTAINANGFLQSNNSQVVVQNPVINLGNINPGDVGINDSNPFIVTLGSSISEEVIDFTFYFSSNVDDYIEYTTSFPLSFNVETASITLGDLNEDLIINVLDVVQLVNIILGTIEPNNTQIEAGNMNQDSFINVQDIIILINLILQ